MDKMTGPKSANDIRAEVEAEFGRMEAELAARNPGVLDVLRVYGEYDEAVRQADAYLAAPDALPDFTTSNSSG